jgi:hypothetical protein
MFKDCAEVVSIRTIASPLILAHSYRNSKNGVLGYSSSSNGPYHWFGSLFGSVWQRLAASPSDIPGKAAVLKPVAKSSLFMPSDFGPSVRRWTLFSSFKDYPIIHQLSYISRYMSSRQTTTYSGRDK